MTNRSKYHATLDVDCIGFLDVRNGGEYGYVEVDQKPYRVRLPDGELIGTVNSLCDALPLILDHMGKEYIKRRRRELERESEPAPLCVPLTLDG